MNDGVRDVCSTVEVMGGKRRRGASRGAESRAIHSICYRGIAQAMLVSEQCNAVEVEVLVTIVLEVH